MLRIRELRTEKGLTQKELGEAIQSTSKNIWAYENNFALPPLDILSRLADFFTCSIDYLVGRSDDFGNVTVAPDLKSGLTAQELQLVTDFRNLPKDLKGRASEYVQTLVKLSTQEKLLDFKPNKN